MKISELEKHVVEFDEWKNTYGPYEIVESLDGTESPNCVWTNISRLSSNYLVNEIRTLTDKYDSESYFLCTNPFDSNKQLTTLTDINISCRKCSNEPDENCEFCYGDSGIWIDITEGQSLLEDIKSWNQSKFYNFFVFDEPNNNV